MPTTWPSTSQVQANPLGSAPPQPTARILPSLHGPTQPQRPMGPPHARSHVTPDPPVLELLAVEPVEVLPPEPADGSSTTTCAPQPQQRRSAPPNALASSPVAVVVKGPSPRSSPG